MFKRNINLAFKLFTFALFITLLTVIYCCAKNTPPQPTPGTTEEITIPDTTERPFDPIAPDTDIITDDETTSEITSFSTESSDTTEVVLKTSPILFTEIDYVRYYDIKLTEDLQFKIQVAIERLEKLDLSEYTIEAVAIMETELDRLIKLECKVSSDLKHYRTWEEEYYYATKVWEYFMQRGFSNEITCAIIGNMMIETAGGTLKLNPTIYSPSGNYYGLCQWSQQYYPETKDLSFEAQLAFLLGSMPLEFNTFGKLYKKGFDYVDFLQLTDTAKAAKAFAVSYERCGEGSYKLRQEAALRAYAYFDLNN